MTNMLHQPYWSTMGPLLVIVITAFVVMILEFLFRNGSRRWLTLISLLGVVVAFVPAIQHFSVPYNPKSSFLLNTIIADGMSSVFTILILLTAFLVLLFTLDYTGHKKIAAEHTYLLLFAVAGALTMATAYDLIALYVGLELLSVSSYVLVAVRKQSVRAVEGGIKYLIMGSIGSATLLYGMSFIYGLTGTTDLVQLASQMGPSLFGNYGPIVVLSFVLMLMGMGFKLSLVPFHMWTPDAYDGAASPVSAFLATLAKSAAFVMLLRILLFGFFKVAPHMFFWAAILAAVTMFVGNIVALPQRNMKRLLAFSSVAQAGYIFIPFALIGTASQLDWNGLFSSIAFYLFAYTFMTVGAFAVVSVVSRNRGSVDDEALVGLYKRSPWLAGALTIFVLSLAGMPLTAGFLGKFYIFTETLHLHYLWLGIVLFGTSVISFYYYLGWLRKVYHRDSEGVAVARIPVGGVMTTLLGLCIAGTLVLGLAPDLLMYPLQHFAQWP
ncbi:NADH-quinone oxidoreductase subunit N [Alicyclobacillus sp. SO9]|uniref:NADH-quinone oxidoreductase subunit N n=1 Tax=Alicyclobacillus sp. SO9 TaxID=2665646 RepID=UPI0018E7EC5A|nr:NADH-quinone oxidoreductase subunit N [Alicyclobacillus sp. SO9]QQE78764.1 NADH-quinone oxidoreductase subunit N [Alicyclobacillus sp. SO9]